MMSLLVARMITPLIAAYFLRSRGVQPHAAWRWMDLYLKVLNWSLDTSKADALLARLPRPSRDWRYYGIGALLFLAVIGAFFAGTGGMMKINYKAGWSGGVSLVLSLCIGA